MVQPTPSSMNLTFSTANANTLTEGFRLTALSNVHIGTFTTDGGQKTASYWHIIIY